MVQVREVALGELEQRTDAVSYAGAGMVKSDGDQRLVNGGVKIFVGYGMYIFFVYFLISIRIYRTVLHKWAYMQFHTGYDFAILPTDAEGHMSSSLRRVVIYSI